VLDGQSFGRFGDVQNLALDQVTASFPGERFLVHTVDFGSPVVPDPYRSGVISACNSLSDIYASGATAITADILLELPRHMQDRADVGAAIVKGIKAVLTQEGVTSIGGHTTLGAELRIGCSVTGIVTAAHFRTHQQAKVGDVLVLTKPVGTGLVFSGLKTGVLSLSDCESAILLASNTNRHASEILTQLDCSTCTDVSGYGLLGAAMELASASKVTIDLTLDSVPVVPGARVALDHGIIPALGEETLFDSGNDLLTAAGITLEEQLLVACPETSGGLLGSLPQKQAELAVEKLQALGAHIVGSVVPWSQRPVRLSVRTPPRY
jgi:selenide,water dikinase